MHNLKPAIAHKGSAMARALFSLFLLVAASASSMAQNRVYELRTYHCFDGKLETLKSNFRDFNIRILKRHGIESVGYWVPQDPALAGNTLIYMLVHPSRAAADKNWSKFLSDPEFKKLAAESMKDGPIIQKIDSIYLDPTDFSPLK
jgi:hypothetical protein